MRLGDGEKGEMTVCELQLGRKFNRKDFSSKPRLGNIRFDPKS
jgi:hypothetical protein